MKYLCLAYGNREKMESLSNGEMESLRRECMPPGALGTGGPVPADGQNRGCKSLL